MRTPAMLAPIACAALLLAPAAQATPPPTPPTPPSEESTPSATEVPDPGATAHLPSGQIELSRLVDLASQKLNLRITYDESAL
ncbi:MAG: hypothetical protein KF699_09360, partial [Phycisphaeraceae bacterium]|nr:hypothetical protein [Phycisphaeraceae bacterium]